MKPIEAIPQPEIARLRGLLFDLDDTLLDKGRLLPKALDALYRLREAGLELYAVTGRPVGWGAVIAHQWPILGAVTENGALSIVNRDGRCVLVDWLEPTERQQRRVRLAQIVAEVRRSHPELEPADDVTLRMSDFTFDIGEHRQVARDVVRRARETARSLGAVSLASSVHLHVSLDRADKATGTLRLLRGGGADPFECLSRYAFIGDSENDAACFAAFRLTLGVRNQSGRPTLGPRFVTRGERAEGFVEAAELLLARRANLR